MPDLNLRRFPDKLKRELKSQACLLGITLHELCLAKLSQAVTAEVMATLAEQPKQEYFQKEPK